MKTLFIDCCMKNGEESRTKVLCNRFFEALKEEHPDYEVETLVLKEEKDLKPYYFDNVNYRYAAVEKGDRTDPIFKWVNQFLEADKVVIGAPYWDMGFPSLLKIYIENIFVGGLTFKGSEKGLVGLAKAKEVLYIQTAGGAVAEDDAATAYLRTVFTTLGAEKLERIGADKIDVVGVDFDGIMAEAVERLQKKAKEW